MPARGNSTNTKRYCNSAVHFYASPATYSTPHVQPVQASGAAAQVILPDSPRGVSVIVANSLSGDLDNHTGN